MLLNWAMVDIASQLVLFKNIVDCVIFMHVRFTIDFDWNYPSIRFEYHRNKMMKISFANFFKK